MIRVGVDSNVRTEEMNSEIRAVVKLCTPGGHKNIIAVLRHGKLPNSHYYFFDMELCEFNLEQYINLLWQPTDLETMLPDASAAKKPAGAWSR